MCEKWFRNEKKKSTYVIIGVRLLRISVWNGATGIALFSYRLVLLLPLYDIEAVLYSL